MEHLCKIFYDKFRKMSTTERATISNIQQLDEHSKRIGDDDGSLVNAIPIKFMQILFSFSASEYLPT